MGFFSFTDTISMLVWIICYEKYMITVEGVGSTLRERKYFFKLNL